MSRRAAICLALVLTAGCRKSTGPDANYDKASRLYQQLYASQLDDAYGDPQMDQVVALLKKVDSHSTDVEAANTMLGAIQHGKEELARSRAERAKRDAAALNAAVTPPPNIDPAQIIATNYPQDAGPPPDPYGVGAMVAEINTATGGCLSEFEPFRENGTGVTGMVYRAVKGPICEGKLPGYVGQALLVVGGKIYRRIPDPGPPNAAPPPVPDAGPPDAGTQAAKARPPAPSPAAQADAGEPEYRFVIPGAPQPGATPPPAQQE